MPANGTIDVLRTVQRNGTLAEARAQPCLGPEDLHVMDNYLYWGSLVQQEVRRIHLVTGVMEVFADISTAIGNSFYVKIGVSDGTFGPRHTVFINTWSVNTAVIVGGFLPGGGRWTLNGLSICEANGYGAAVAVGRGRLVFGMSDYGIWEVRKGDPGDLNMYIEGKHQYKANHGRERWGAFGFGTFGQPLPWGQSVELDYFLTKLGHSP